MSQFPSGSQTSLISNAPTLVYNGASQLTFFSCYNPTASDGWIKFYDSPTAASTPTGSTCAIYFFVPANSQRIVGVESGNTIDPDGIWAFASGMVAQCVTGNILTSNSAPSSPFDIRLQFKP